MPIGKDPGREEPDDLSEHLLALRHFTDRVHAVAAFRRHLDAPSDRVLPVLMFSGVGGVGKSLLVRKLISEMRDGQGCRPVVLWRWGHSHAVQARVGLAGSSDRGRRLLRVSSA